MERLGQRGLYEAPEAGAYLWDYLQELGVVKPTGMGPEPVTYPDIESWSRMTGIPLTPWETTVLYALSRTYCIWLTRGGDEKAMPPWTPENPAAVADKIRAVFGGRK